MPVAPEYGGSEHRNTQPHALTPLFHVAHFSSVAAKNAQHISQKIREHKRYPSERIKRVPLCNLYLSMLQRFGVTTETFGTSTGTIADLDLA